MNTADKKHAKCLQDALQALYHSGPSGFEGFLGIILGEITGQSFRLAKSGTQRGRDGDSAFDGGATYFEGKRYKASPAKSEIAAKLFDLANDDAGQVDLWILGATCEVASQTVDDARKFGAKHGIGIALLDWSSNDLGSLLVATVAAGSKSGAFIKEHLAGKTKSDLIAPAVKAISHFEKHSDFPSRLSALKKALSEDVGLGHEKTLNQAWLNKSFMSKTQARAEFGQPLSPLDPSGTTALDRPERALLANAFSGQPESDIYAIVGEEGVGKSWLAVQSWIPCDPKSLLVICPADDLTRAEAASDFDEFLIRKLINQTGGSVTPQAMQRWRRRFKAWRANIPASSVRVTLVADGLNQPLRANWSRWLDRAALQLKSLGGCLVVTTRAQHWTHLKNSLSSSVKTIPLGDWSIQNVKQILGSQGIDFTNARTEVLNSLRNPRLLGIALELMHAKAIELLDELSVGRLLFEQMRRTEQHGAAPISAPAFADLLKDLAAKVLERANAQEKDDLRLFDAVQESQIETVASGRFFSSVRGTASKYEIRPDGLNLALALYLINELERELRNKRDPRDRLATILEPISALDETAKVALWATQIACLDEETSPEARSALLEKFVSLQNLPNSEADAFAVLAKSAPVAFLQAAENVHLSREHFANDDWLLYALLNRRGDSDVWREILEAAKRWLSLYSIEPERRMHKAVGRDSAAEVDEERTRILADIEKREAALTETERSYIKTNLVAAPHAMFDALSRFALYLLAGMPCKDIAPYLVRWRFSYALNASSSAPYTEFEQVLHYNRMDWPETRLALLKALELLPVKNSSNIGKWTRVGVLYATGDTGDAEEAVRLRDELVRDRDDFQGWSLKEDYCAVDPYDPSTTKPENVVATAKKYRIITPAKVATARGMGEQDHFFREARAGVVRFSPDDAIHTHRAIADDVLKRAGYARRQGVLELCRHSAALSKDQALQFLSAGASSTASFKDGKDDRDEFLTAQYSVLIALPHLTADEQLDAVANMQGDTLLLELLSCLQKATPEKVEQVMERVLQTGSEDAQTAVLAAIHYSESPLTPRAVAITKNFIRSQNKNVRREAFAVAASTADRQLLTEVVESGWSADKPYKRDSGFEDWHGSTAILKALQMGLIATDSALDRVNLSHYGFAAQTLPAEQIAVIATRIEVALGKALGHNSDASLPNITTGVPKPLDPTPPLISLDERPPLETDVASQMARISETDDQFDERQRRMGDAYERFAEELTAAEANLILSDLTFDGVKAIVGQDGDRDERWLAMLLSASDRQLRHLHHFALQVAIALGSDGNPRAPDFIIRVMGLDPTIRRVIGVAKIPAEVIALWCNATNPSMEGICKRRLSSPRTDADIAREVIAAQLCGRMAFLETFIDELLTIGRPYETCLALTIAGFCDTNAHVETVLSRFSGVNGFIGAAHKAASESYVRNIWAKTWYFEMQTAEQPEDFWRASVLFTKIVDGRFGIWSGVSRTASTVFNTFMPTIDREIESRAAKLQKQREANLFGEKAPVSIMLGIA